MPLLQARLRVRILQRAVADAAGRLPEADCVVVSGCGQHNLRARVRHCASTHASRLSMLGKGPVMPRHVAAHTHATLPALPPLFCKIRGFTGRALVCAVSQSVVAGEHCRLCSAHLYRAS